MTIGARIDECMNKLSIGDAENAFIQLSIAVDGTAKRLHPGKKTTDRCKNFLRDNLPFVLWSLTNGTPSQCKDLSFQFNGPVHPSQSTKFEDLVYSIMRCALLHEGEMPEKVEFVSESYIGMLGGRMQFPIALVGSLLLAVIASPVNAREKVSSSTSFTFGKTKVYVSEFIGNLEKTRDSIRLGFQYDVEKLLKDFDARDSQAPAA
jgi:hypothetical protein